MIHALKTLPKSALIDTLSVLAESNLIFSHDGIPDMIHFLKDLTRSDLINVLDALPTNEPIHVLKALVKSDLVSVLNALSKTDLIHVLKALREGDLNGPLKVLPDLKYVLKNLEDKGTIISVYSGSEEKKRRLGEFSDECKIDFMSLDQGESLEMYETVAMGREESQPSHQLSEATYSGDPMEEAESSQEASGAWHSGVGHESYEADMDMDEEVENVEEAFGTSHVGF